ncbi:BAG family molecular chaperone regulator 1-like isoform X2 [Mercenaria mercenaria]|uniref:BAG family molecular chaperone regulator 1-like isoform X2 n=1 Tax=Mercenaria mercenaria TaxID=6596 RepID=UPI00234F5562|nr:BAG family molecular chaperone regulator 1-like isoform X2 [Mercenaria mercenaria]
MDPIDVEDLYIFQQKSVTQTSRIQDHKMAAAAQQSLTLQVIHGPKKYDVKLHLPENEAGDPLCVRHLTDAVYSLTEIPAEAQKLIYKGKSLKNPKEDLVALGLKAGAKVMLIGKKPTPQDDEETRAMNEVESNMEKQEKKLSDITYELDGIHRGYLNKEQQADSIKHLEKRLAGVAETLMRLLEKLDALSFEEANKGARGKRKSLVNKIQVLLTRIDGLSRGVSDMLARWEVL